MGCALLQLAVAADGNTFPAQSWLAVVSWTNDGNMSEIARRPTLGLKPLESELKPEVREWVGELRAVWETVGLSMGQFAVLYPFDKGTISRYLNGRRVPSDHHFLNMLLSALASNGRPVTPVVREHLAGLHMRALEAAHPHEYRVRLVKDELEIALTGKLEAERYATALESQLAKRNREMQELVNREDRLHDAWEGESERLGLEIDELTKQLDHAQYRAFKAEERCQRLELRLELVDILDQADFSASAVRDAVAQKTLDDPLGVVELLKGFHYLGMYDQASALADHAADHIPLVPAYYAFSTDEDALSVEMDPLVSLIYQLMRMDLTDQVNRLISRIEAQYIPIRPYLRLVRRPR